MRNQYSLLNPKALAIAGGAGAVAISLLFGFGMMGAGSVMGTGSIMGGGWMMGGYGGYGGNGTPTSHWSTGGGLVMLVTLLFIGLVAGWITALVYNMVVRQPEQSPESRAERSGNEPAVPNQP